MDEFGRGASFEADGCVYINFDDEYEHLDSTIIYDVECVLQTTNQHSVEFEQLRDHFNSLYANYCTCSKTKAAKNIECHTDDCKHGNNYMIRNANDNSSHPELILNEGRRSHDLIFECTDMCACNANCGNRLVQFGPRKNLAIANFAHLGKELGLITMNFIPKGAFICEYVGEILTTSEARKRLQENDATKQMNYILCLNEISTEDDALEQKTTQTFIDPTKRGNIGRYLNHSCDPNCGILSVRVNGAIPRISTKRVLNMCQIVFHFFNAFFCSNL